MAGRALQIIPAGARPIAPGVFQLSRRHHGARSGKGKGKKHGGHRHQSWLAQRQIKYAAVLQFGRALQAKQFTNVPAWINFPALILYLWGQNKRDKGAISVAKALQYDTMASGFGVSSMMGLMIQSGLSGGFLGGVGAFGSGGGIPSVKGISDQSGGGGGGGGNDLAANATAAAALINAVENV